MNPILNRFKLFIFLSVAVALETSLQSASVTLQPVSQTVADNSEVTFLVGVTGNGEISYQWKKDGVNIPSATSNTYSIPNAKPWHTGEYTVSVSDSVGTDLSLPASLNILGANSALWRGLIYFWPMNGDANDNGVLNNHFSINHATLAPDKDSRDDSCFYFNGTSASMVSEQPSVIAGSSPRTVSFWYKHADLNHYLGKPVMFGWGNQSHSRMFSLISDPQDGRKFMSLWGDWIATNFGTNWLSDGNWRHAVLTLAAPASESSARLYINGVEIAISEATDGGTYNTAATKFRISTASDDGYVNNNASFWWNQGFKGWMDNVRVYNRTLSASEVAQLYTYEGAGEPEVLIHPHSLDAYTDQTTEFSVTASGTGPLNYQWRKNGNSIPSATGSTLTIANVNFRDSGSYDVIVTDDIGTVTSEIAVLTVISRAPNVSIAPGGITLDQGEAVTFTTTINAGISPFTYQWRRNGKAISRATNASLTLLNIQKAQEGLYDVVVKNGYGVDVSSPARLSLTAAVPVDNAPESTDVDLGETATFSVNVPEAVAWQWLKNGSPIKGAVTSTLNVPNVDARSVGLYSVTVTTPSGKVTTVPAQLRMNDNRLLIYKLTGTGKAYQGTAATNAAINGYLILDRTAQRGGLIIGSKSGSQNIHRLEIHEDLDIQSTGPVLKSQTVVSELAEGEFALWMNGTDGLLKISKTDSAVGPATMKGFANSINTDSLVQIETVSLTLTIDAINSTTARLHQETVEQAMSRISQNMQAKGSALVD